MGFTAAPVFAPNVPDKMDPIKYLTMPPQTRMQEQAQAQAKALAYARQNGTPAAEIERIIFGVEQQNLTEFKSVSLEEAQEYQDAKSCVIPSQLPTSGTSNTALDYPFLFTNFRSRTAYPFMDSSRSKEKIPSRLTSSVGKRPAPYLELSLDEYKSGTQYIEKIKDLLAEFGIVKLHLSQASSSRIPFGVEVTGFRSRQQVVLRSQTEFNLRQVKRGFHRAMIRFHTAVQSKRRVQKLPIVEGKPVDFYRMFNIVERHNGAEVVTKRKEWAQVGREMGYSSSVMPTLSSTMRQLYQRMLEPFRAFIIENLETPLDPHCVPRFDVDDENTSTWFRLPHSIVVDTSITPTNYSDRKHLDFDEIKNNPSAYTLKLFRLKHNLSVPGSQTYEDLEKQYLQLPEYYQSERVHPPIKLHRHPKEAASLSGIENPLDMPYKPWDITTLSLRENNDFFPFITQDFVNFLTADLHISSEFSTQQMYKPKGGAYEVHTTLEGKPRTWYTKSGTWTDQNPSDIIIVDPSAEVTHWSHGYNVSASAPVLLNSNWLEKACESFLAGTNTDVNVQQVVSHIVNSCYPSETFVKPHVKRQTLAAIEMLRQYELKNMAELGACEKKLLQPSYMEPARCSKSQQLLYFSWIILDGAVLSVPEYLKTRTSPDNTGAMLVTRVGDDVEEYFKYMRSVIDWRREAETTDWKVQANHCLGNKARPLMAVELEKLAEIAPRKYEIEAKSLATSSQKLKEWLADRCPKDQFEKVECFDSNGKVDAVLKEMQDSIVPAQAEFDNFLDFVSRVSDPKMEISFSELARDGNIVENTGNRLLQLHASNLGVEAVEKIEKVLKLVEWTKYTVAIVNRAKTDPTPSLLPEILRQLEIAGELEIPTECAPFTMLISLRSQASEVNTRVRHIWRSELPGFTERVLDCKRLMFDPFKGMPIMHPGLHEEFRQVYQAIPIINSMENPNYLLRPKRTQLVGLSFLDIVQFELKKLDSWLEEAKMLDWVTIATQLANMAAMKPPTISLSTPRISISRIVEVFTQLHHLRAVPDDVESVKSTFENTIDRLTRTAPMSVLPYGFDP